MVINDTYNIEIDNKNYSIPIKNIHDFMTMCEEKFINLCTDNNIKTIYNLPKDFFAYACFTYMNNNYDTMLQTPIAIRRRTILGRYELIDFEAVNKFLQSVDYVYNKAVINSELLNIILKDIPEYLNKLEIAIYIYIKMCQIFTYDRNYFALNQKCNKTIEDLKIITKNNREIACFEFVVIYGKILDSFGINFRNYYGDKPKKYEFRDFIDNGKEAYGKSHAFTEFRVGKYLIEADSTETIFEGDLIKSKINKELIGLKCLNANRNTQESFTNMYKRVYNMLKKNNNKYHLIDENYLNHKKDLDLNERIIIFLNTIKSLKLTGLDASAYLIMLKKELFTEEELISNISINVIRNNQPQEDKDADILTIISINKEGFNNSANETQYYLYYPNNKLISSNVQYIQKEFNIKSFEYIRIKDLSIPGIVEPGIMSNYRKKLKR